PPTTAAGHPRHWPRNSIFGTVFDPLHVILPPLGSTSHNGVASRRDELVAGGISVPSSLCCRRTCNSRLHPRMPSTYYHPYLNSPTARDEPDARLCAVCELTCAAKNRDGFVKVHRVGEDACHGRYLVVFGRASVLKSSVLVACQRAGLAPMAHRDCVLDEGLLKECYKQDEDADSFKCTVQGSRAQHSMYFSADTHGELMWSMTACACGARMSNPPQPCGAQCRGSMPLEPMPMLLDKEAARQAALNAECIRLMLWDNPGMPQFDTLNKDLLKAWCKHNNIRGVSSKSKNELRDMCLLKLREKVEAPRHM
ncbi:hypothetical protein HaLaN_04709, partial [Haematococcus lacustris]